MKQTAIVAIILFVLLVIAVVQGVQLSSLKSKVAGGSTTTISAQPANAAVNVQDLQSAPSSGMVGGC